MDFTHQPLITTLSNTKTILFCIFCLPALVLYTAFLASHLIQVTHSDPGMISAHVCDNAYDPGTCLSMISDAISNNGAQEPSGIDVVHTLLSKSLLQMKIAMEEANHTRSRLLNDLKVQASLSDCLELIDMSVDRVKDKIAALPNWSINSHAEIHAWLSGVLTNYDTCLDEINNIRELPLKSLIQELIAMTRTSLAMISSFSASNKNVTQQLNEEFPSWLASRDRKILESPLLNVTAKVVVAQDGSGNYRTIQEAVSSAPNKSKTRYVIYVKEGTYKENVEVGKQKTNLMIIGDGMDLTVITGSLSVVDGSTTFKSATLAVGGAGFILQDIWIQNTAGPGKHQAVALRVSADHAVIIHCRIDGYQDTLYAHTYRQFYRDCTILGTIDFIFGNAAVVLQNCKIICRLPMFRQKNMVTAQGRTDLNQNTGISIQNCHILASPELQLVQNLFPTYLGRPWKEYSRTVVMQSYIGSHVNQAGWFEWNGEFALKTLYYGDYANRGPGSDASKRVNWDGFHVITEPNEAVKFGVEEFIQGKGWLVGTGVCYFPGL